MGDITDSSGAAIPDVTVTVIHEGTGVERKVQTNEAGQYRVTPLNPGTYTIQVESSGFKRQVRSGVVLEVSAVLEVDFTLQVGEVTETIEVTAVTPVLRTEEASVGNVVNSQELERLPVNQRNYTRLILLMPGTSSVTRSQQQGDGPVGHRAVLCQRRTPAGQQLHPGRCRLEHADDELPGHLAPDGCDSGVQGRHQHRL